MGIEPLYRGETPMPQLTVTLSKERFLQLQKKAERLRVSPEALLRLSLEELLTRPDDEFQRVMRYVLRKNTELYQRLAAL